MKKSYYPAFVLLAVFLFYLSYINNGFTWLDHGDIERGRAIIPITNLKDAFFTRFGQTGFYRPVVTIINSIDFALYGLWAHGFHLTNVILHTAVSGAAVLFIGVFFPLTFYEK